MKDFLFYIRDRFKWGRYDRILPLLGLYRDTALKRKFDAGGDPAPIDLVIPTIAKDYPLLETVIASIRANLTQPINKVFIVSRSSPEIEEFCAQNGFSFIEETSLLGYGKERIQYRPGGVDRSGWIFQQLLKLSGDRIAEMDNYVIVDSDTVLVSQNSFLQNGKFVFFQNKEWHEPYFRAFQKMFGYPVRHKLSFTSHMMIFNREYLREMKAELARNGGTWDLAYLAAIDQDQASAISDYDTYAGWVFANHPETVIEKPLYNKSVRRTKLVSLPELEKTYGRNYKTISFHSYLQ